MNKHTIKNEKEYRISKSWLKKFNESKVKLAKMPDSIEQPWLKKAAGGSLRFMINHLEEEIREYEALKSGKIKLPKLDNLNALPELLIKKRIANGWTQVQMAKRLGLHYQQIQRYENTGYASATLETLQKFASVLDQGPLKSKRAAAHRISRS